jgi:hypothetical protein
MVASKFDPEFIPPTATNSQNPLRPVRIIDGSALRTLPSLTSEEDKELAEKVRALQMDCVGDTIAFCKYPVIIGAMFGAMKAAALAKPKYDASEMRLSTGYMRALKGIAGEVKYLRNPVLFLGGTALVYSSTQCFLAKLTGRDSVQNAAISSGLSGCLIGIFLKQGTLRNNAMFIYGFWGALIGAGIKYLSVSPYTDRALLTYNEVRESRQRLFRAELRDESGYVSSLLHEGLKEKGVKV